MVALGGEVHLQLGEPVGDDGGDKFDAELLLLVGGCLWRQWCVRSSGGRMDGDAPVVGQPPAAA